MRADTGSFDIVSESSVLPRRAKKIIPRADRVMAQLLEVLGLTRRGRPPGGTIALQRAFLRVMSIVLACLVLVWGRV